MTSSEIKSLIDAYKKQSKKTKVERPLTREEVHAIMESRDNIPDKYKGKFDAAFEGDFSKFESLPLLLRNTLGAIEVGKFTNRFGKTPSYDNPNVQQYLKDNAMNAAFRAGMSALKNSTELEERELGSECDKFMNNSLMQRTMMPPSEEDVQRFTQAVGEQNAPAELNRNLERQRVMAKALLMAQLGKYEVLNSGNSRGPLQETLSETLAHGGRTSFVLPSGEDSKIVFDAFLGANNGREAGVYKRSAATHYVSRREIDASGKTVNETEEEKLYVNLNKILRHQHGMDIAVGGIGSKGPGTTPVTGRGESGHAYMRIEKGDKTHCAALLFGIEGCAPQTTSYLGNEHGIRAKSAKQSAFIAGKGSVGNKLGGRQIDLSGLSSQELSNILNTFDQKYAELQGNANTPEGREKLAAINDMLMGKPMETKKLIGMFNELGMGSKDLEKSVEKARNGMISKIEPSKMTDEEFKQSIRGAYNQKDACKLAKARFERSGDNIVLATGAVKELMFTHATRSASFKFWHPIQNYKEKSTINSLIKKLETEKHFSRSDIAAQMILYNNSFALNWGEGLSNDPTHIKFSRANTMNFKPNEYKLSKLLQDTCKEKFKNIDLQSLAQIEQEEMENEFEELLPNEYEKTQEILNGPSNSKREPCPVPEANEELSTSNISQQIHQAPQTEKHKIP